MRYNKANMLGIVFRLIWRLVVLVAGITVAYLIIKSLFPYLDRHLPLLLVVAILYAISAYIAIPLLIRLWRVAIKPNHIPMYVITGDGWPSDPVNIAIVCRSREQLIETMTEAGWTQADESTFFNMLREGWAILFKKQYPTAPFSSLYLFNRRQDIGFQIQEGNPPTPRHRHHVRFWLLDQLADDTHHNFWQALLQKFLRSKQQVWIGAATHDVRPFDFRMRNLQITHRIDSDTNKERDFLIKTIKNTGYCRGVDIVESGHKLAFRGQTFGVNLVVDGELKIVKLRTRRSSKT